VFKKIFGQHPELIKSFLNNILPLPEGRFIETIAYLTPEQAPRIPSLKNTIVDVKCTDQQGNIFIVEMQMTWSKNFMKRFLFGVSKAYVQQLDAGKAYSNLCPVYGVAIVNEAFEDTTQDWFHHYRLTNTKDLDKTLEGIELLFLELPKFNPKTFGHKKVGALWLRFLKETKDLKDIPEEFRDSPEITKAIELAEESAYTAAELEVYDEYLDAIRVQQTVRDDSYEEGREEGREEGKEEEKQKNLEEKKNMASKLLAKGMSIEEVSDLTGLNIGQIGKFTA